MSVLLSILRTWIGILGWQAIGFLIMAATIALAARLVPPDTYGRYWIALSIVQVVTGVGLSWIGQSVLLCAREEVHRVGDMRGTLLSALAVQAGIYGLIVAAAIAAYLVVPPASGLSGVELSLMLALVALMAASETTGVALQAVQRFEGLGIGSVLAKLGPLAALIAVWSGVPARADVLIAGAGAGMLAALAVTIAVMPHRTGPHRTGSGRASLDGARRLVGYGAKLPIAIAAGVAATWMQVWFVQAYSGGGEAGIYGWAASLFALVTAALSPLAAAITPHLMDLAINERRDAVIARVELFMAAGVVAVAALPIALAVVSLGMGLVPRAYAGAGPVIVALLTAAPGQLVCALYGPLLRAYPRMIGAVVGINVTIAAAAVVLNLALTTRYGALGAAFSTSIAMWMGTLMLLRLAHGGLALDRGTRRSAVPTAAVCALVSLAAGAMVLILPAPLALAAAAALTPVLLFAARAAGALEPIAALAAILPPAARRVALLTLFLGWCNTPRPDRPL